MHIDGDVDNMNESERKYLRCRLDLMDSESVVVDVVDGVEVADANTTNTSDAMYDEGDENFPT